MKGIQINYKICDNAQECNGLAVCPTKALSWDKEAKTIKIDNSKCNCCGLCAKACEVSAIFLAKNDKEFEKIKKEIEADPRKVTDLFIDRYGATPIRPAFLIPEEKFDLEVVQSNKIAVAELFNCNSIMCLRYSIPIKDLLKDFEEIKFRKVNLTSNKILKKYNIKKVPALVFFKEGKLLGKVEGYYEDKDKEELMKKDKSDNEMTKDYYKVLGVDKKASKEEIKKAYKTLAKKFHPDINKEAGAEAKFKEINEAVSVLADDEKRQQYDQFGTADFQGSGFGGAGFSDFMRGFDYGSFDFDNIFDMFFHSGGSRRRSRSSRGTDLQYDLEITLKEAASGTEKKIPLNKLDKCKACGGQGGEVEGCEGCGGNGYVRKTARTPFGLFQTQTPCSKCHGAGMTVKEKCSECDGEGRVRIKKTLTVTIPAGVDNGSRLRVRGEGIASENGGTSGDLYVVIYVKPDDIFRRDGDDLYISVPISFTQASLGDEIEVPTIDGKAQLKIPAGTQSHTLFKMKGKGMPNLDGYGNGDQLVRVEIHVPEKLSKKQKELLNDFAKLESEKPSKSFFDKIFGVF